MKVVLVMLVVTAVLLIYQTTSPVRITESMIFSYKHKMLLGEAETVASSLSSSQNLTSQGAEEIMSVLGARDMGQVVITDGDGVVLYSSNLSVSPVGSCTLYPEIVSALRGNDAFRCSFTGDAFVSRGAIPVMFGGDTIGCVYMVEIDSEQAELLTSIQNNAVRTSIITVLVSLILYVVFGLVVIRKNESLLQSIRRVQDGDYEHRVEVKGKDEFAVLANEFNALTDRLQQTEQIRRQFVSDASHELRTPLAAMRLLSDSILQNDMDQDTIREFVQDISGEAVRGFTLMFLQMWNVDTRRVENYERYLNASFPVDAPGYVLPYGDRPFDEELVGETVYMDILNRAQRYVHITTPYLIVDNELLTALTYAAKRGVEVVLIVPAIPDKTYVYALNQTYYRELIEAGVEVREYTPGFVHAKMFVSDDTTAVVGSINLDYRSLYLHFECAALLYGCAAVADVERDIQETRAKSRVITLEDCKRRKLIWRFLGWILRPLAPLM